LLLDKDMPLMNPVIALMLVGIALLLETAAGGGFLMAPRMEADSLA